MRAGDVIPQVVSPAPHVLDRPGKRPPRPRPPSRCPFCNTKTVKPREGVFTQVPQSRLPRARVAAAQALRLPRRHGHRGSRREAGRAAAGARAGAHRRRLLPADRRAADRAGGVRRAVGAQPDRRDRGLQATPVRARAVRAGHRGGRRDHRAQPRHALSRPSMRCCKPRPRRSPRRPASARRWRARSATSSSDERMRALISDLRGLGLQLREQGPPPSEGSTGGQDARADRHPAPLDARAGHRTNHGRGRARDRVGVEATPTTSSRASPPDRSWPRPSASRCRCWTNRVCARCWRSSRTPMAHPAVRDQNYIAPAWQDHSGGYVGAPPDDDLWGYGPVARPAYQSRIA